MKIKKQNLSVVLTLLIAAFMPLNAKADICMVQTETDVQSSSARHYGSSIRSKFATLSVDGVASCSIDNSDYFDTETNSSSGDDHAYNGFIPMYGTNTWPEKWVMFNTTAYSGGDAHINEIEFKNPLTLNVKAFTLVGNPSYYAAQYSDDLEKLVDNNNSERDAEYSSDAVNVLSGYGDAGLITLDFRTNFKTIDFNTDASNTDTDADGHPEATKDADDIDWSQFPLKCSASSEKVALWNTIILLPDSFYGKNRNNSHELKKIIFDGSRDETACLVDFGAVYVCVGTRKTSGTSYIDPNTQASGSDIDAQNNSWCEAADDVDGPGLVIFPDRDFDITFLDHIWWPDVDQDSYGAAGEGVWVRPGQDVPVDENGNPYINNAGDCDDAANAVNPDAEEICDGIDNDCDEHIDEVLGSDGSTYESVCDTIYYEDNDGDGSGGAETTVVTTVTTGGDCDDADAERFPGNPEVCDGIDNDCDTIIDNMADGSTCEGTTLYEDNDGDGYGDEVSTDGSGVETGGDCNDANSAINPDATEICENGLDDDCDGTDDVCTLFYDDVDGDGYGDDGTVHNTRDADDVTVAGDCDDSNPAINPGATEVCENGVDENCSGTDDACTFYYDDVDGDGYGDDNTAHTVGDANDVTFGGDCDDTNQAINPSVAEICENGSDENCDGSVDEGCAVEICDDGFDNDGNGLQDCEEEMRVCNCSDEDEDGVSVVDGDCDDSDDSIHPGAASVCNGIDMDCDGAVNDDNVCILGNVDGSGSLFGDGKIQMDGAALFNGCSLHEGVATQNHPNLWLMIVSSIFGMMFVVIRKRSIQ